MAKTKIEWTEYTWNPVTGCTKLSEGCQNCYAKRMSKRLSGRFGYPTDDPFRVTLHPERLEEPLRWKKPRKVFVCSMGDLFHEDVPYKFIYHIWDIMMLNRQHTFLVLTKRPGRMKDFIEWAMANRINYANTFGNTKEKTLMRKWAETPAQHIWLGVTAENQERADERIPILLQVPAAKRFVSIEPMLGSVDLTRLALGYNNYGLYFHHNSLTGWSTGYNEKTHNRKVTRNDQFSRLDWVICGGETGPNARPLHPDWVRYLQAQCHNAGVPFFFKSWGEWLEFQEATTPGRVPTSRLKGELYKFNNTEMIRVGKKSAGRTLDGREWEQIPFPSLKGN